MNTMDLGPSNIVWISASAIAILIGVVNYAVTNIGNNKQENANHRGDSFMVLRTTLMVASVGMLFTPIVQTWMALHTWSIPVSFAVLIVTYWWLKNRELYWWSFFDKYYDVRSGEVHAP